MAHSRGARRTNQAARLTILFVVSFAFSPLSGAIRTDEMSSSRFSQRMEIAERLEDITSRTRQLVQMSPGGGGDQTSGGDSRGAAGARGTSSNSDRQEPSRSQLPNDGSVRSTENSGIVPDIGNNTSGSGAFTGSGGAVNSAGRSNLDKRSEQLESAPMRHFGSE